MTDKKDLERRWRRSPGCLVLFLALTIGIGTFGNLVHQHGDLSPKQSCTICLCAPQLMGEIMEGFRDLPEPSVSFTCLEIILDLRGSERIASNAIRAPPAA